MPFFCRFCSSRSLSTSHLGRNFVGSVPEGVVLSVQHSRSDDNTGLLWILVALDYFVLLEKRPALIIMIVGGKVVHEFSR